MLHGVYECAMEPLTPNNPKNKKEYNVHRHTKNLELEAKLIKKLSHVDKLMSLVPGRVVYDFKNDPDRK